MKRILFLFLLLVGGVANAVSPPPHLAVTGATVREGNTGQRSATFRVILSKASAKRLSVVVGTANGTARAGEDYIATRKTLSFASGTTSQTFSVPIIGDTKIETDETFRVLAFAKGYAVENPAAICTIRNDDAPPKPTPTPRPNPTATAIPTATALPEPTFTPVPTPTASPEPTSTPVPVAAKGKLLFNSAQGGSNSVWAINADGSNRTRIVGDSGGGQWSPDGTKILFSTRQGLSVSLADGSNAVPISQPIQLVRGGRWSPDGSKITFVASHPASGHPELDDSRLVSLYVVNVDGSDLRLISSSVFFYFGSWSPDSKRLLWSDSRSGNAQIFVANADGGDQTNLSNNSRIDWNCKWSPDGKRIAFNSTVAFTSEELDVEQVCTINADGSERRQIKIEGDVRNMIFANWSPDSQKLALTAESSTSFYCLYVVNADGSNVVNLSDYAPIDYYPRWSPDSRKLLVPIARSSPRQIYVIGADGSNPINVSQNPLGTYFSDNPVWSPDGTKVGWFRYDNRFQIIIANPDGSGQTDISTPDVEDIPYISWAPGSVPTPSAASPSVPRSSRPNSSAPGS